MLNVGSRRIGSRKLISPLRPGMRLEGPAFAVEGEPRDQDDPDASIRRILAMLGDVPAGAVPVYATHDDEAAQFGELSATSLQAKGCPGVVLDGGCRDTGFIEEIGFPVFCRYATPLDSVPRWHCAEWGHAVTIGGVGVATGDWLVADADGVVVVPAALRDEVLEKAGAVAGTEDRVREAVRRGVPPLAAYDEHGKF